MSTKIMHKRSLKCQEANKLVAIYTSREGDDFEAGYIEVVTASDVMFRSRRSDGYEEGHVVLPLELVYRIEIDTAHLKTAELLAKHLNQPISSGLFEKAPNKKHSLFEIAADYVYQSKEIIFIDIIGDETPAIGMIAENEYEGLEITLVDDEGRLDGTCWIKKEDILALRFGGSVEQDLMNKLKK
ncbi:hypothetical protein NWH89_001243 [Listeria monocytogenes]|nr:hypothetical protein [Listeria monocytogenes]EAD8166978.1 hypothetical protein [Listeria monocytogenes]EAG5472892.1 hypothetical protein [Listeria monocytogenes]EBF5163526.1 hypothetical protein [Listeria monocytogenes]EJS8552253.1 hypothetical protein [Listeria monocytogenes]